MKIIYTFKHLVSTSKTTQRVSIAKINWLMQFKEIIAVYFERSYDKPTNALCGQNAELLNIKADGTYSCHCAKLFSET
jgi:hypothetical protein